MKAKRTVGVWILMCVGCLATGATAGSYTWTGNVSDAWDEADNWVYLGCVGPSCYPSTTDDDAIFPTDADWTCDLVTEEIDDLAIVRDVVFAGDDDPVLRVDTVTILGRSGVGTIATITEGAEITTVSDSASSFLLRL